MVFFNHRGLVYCKDQTIYALGKIIEYRKIAKSLFAKLRNKCPDTAGIKLSEPILESYLAMYRKLGRFECVLE